MAKVYRNKTGTQQTIFFDDGSAQFLGAGQKVEVTKKIKRMSAGIVEVVEKNKIKGGE